MAKDFQNGLPRILRTAIDCELAEEHHTEDEIVGRVCKLIHDRTEMKARDGVVDELRTQVSNLQRTIADRDKEITELKGRLSKQ